MDPDQSNFAIRPATEEDVPLVLEFIRELAEYENLLDQFVATEKRLGETLFGDRPHAEVLIGELGSRPVGFALYFHNYSTFLAKPGLYLEDLFIRPGYRGKGFGKAMLRRLAGIAVERGCGRFEWSVLDWNKPAIEFYKALGAQPMDDWTVYRLSGEPLTKLAEERD